MEQRRRTIGLWILGAVLAGLFNAQALAQFGDPVSPVDLGPITTGAVSGIRANLISDVDRTRLTQMALAPGFESSIFFSEREGGIIQVDLTNPNPSTNFTLVGDVANELGSAFGDGRSIDWSAGDGMRGLAFHPDFADPEAPGFGKLYTTHEEVYNSGTATFPDPAPALSDPSARQDGVLTEWTYNPSDGTFLNNPREVLRAQIVDGHHPVQQIVFNPTALPGDVDYGNLYIGVGEGALNPTAEGGGGGTFGDFDPDPANITQVADNVHGKILRINPLQDGQDAYSVPTGAGGNVFANDNDSSTLAEIFAYGLRHPQTLGFNRQTGDLFVGDIGQDSIEELNIVVNGGNYGWGIREGTYIDGLDDGSGNLVFNGIFREALPATRDSDEFIYPVAQFSHIRGGSGTGPNAIVGGFAYQGQLATELEGLFIFGNLSNDDIFYAPVSDLTNDNDPAQFFELQLEDDNQNPISFSSLVGNIRTLMRFGQDQAGEIYVFSQTTGQVFRLEGTPANADFNGDSIVNLADYTVWRDNLGGTGADANGDDQTDLEDYAIWKQQFGGQFAASNANGLRQVPEPASLCVALELLVAGVLVAARRGDRRCAQSV